MFKLLWQILKDEYGVTLNVTYNFSPNTLISSSQVNQNFTDTEGVVNALTSVNYADDSVTAAKLNLDVVRLGFGLIQHTDGSLYVDVSDTNPCLEIIDGGVRVKVDNNSIERALGGLQVKALGITNAMLAGSIDLTAKVTGALPDTNLAAITTANKVNTSALYGTAYLPDATVDTTALKTAIGEVSSGSTGNVLLTLPGGSYGFYPQIRQDTANAGQTFDAGIIRSQTGSAIGATYVTRITLQGGDVSNLLYAQQRYVTASGKDLWIFLLIDRITKDIFCAYSASDHPAYGNGGNFEKVPHPFGNYDETKYEIILLDKETCLALKIESETTGKSVLTLLNEEYRPNITKEETYQPLHSGKFIGSDPELVQTIPIYIKVRKLEKLTPDEKNQKEATIKQMQQKAEQDKQKKAQDKKSAENKLRMIGLTESELEALKVN